MTVKGKGGKPALKLTPKDYAKIKRLASFGLSNEQIADVMGIGISTLKKHAAEHLKIGRSTAGVPVIESAYRQAISGKCPAMTMFWLKCRMRWREVQPEDNDEEKLEKVKAAVKDIIAALNQAKQPPPPAAT